MFDLFLDPNVPLTDAEREKLEELFSQPPLKDMPIEDLMDILIDMGVPLSGLTPEELIEILEGLVPRAGTIPMTGDSSQIWEICALLTGTELVWMSLKDRKRKEDAERAQVGDEE